MDFDAQIADAEERLWQAYLELKAATERLVSIPGYVPEDPKAHAQALAMIRKAEAYFAPRISMEFNRPDPPRPAD